MKEEDKAVNVPAAWLDSDIVVVSKWYWPTGWYKIPYALELGGWSKFDRFVKHNYPIQSFIRSDVVYWFFNQYEIFRSLKYKIKYRICNPRRRMMKVVFQPAWRDLDNLVIDFHMQCLIEIVDEEKIFESNDYTHSDESRTFAAELKECYAYAKTDRAKLLKAIDDAYPPLRSGSLFESSQSYLELYGAVEAAEKHLTECDDKVMLWVIQNRAKLWT
jgi:hypothetical protein